MIDSAIDLVSVALAGLTGAGLVQCGAGLAAVTSFCRGTSPEPLGLPPVTILKPLHGDEPMLEAALASIVQQDYPTYQIVFGVQDAGDEALAIVARLRARFPAVPIDVVIDGTQHGLNRKVGNLINMVERAEHDVLVIGDSDMHVAPDYLRRVVAALERPGTGLVTSLYSGLPGTATLTGALGAANVNHAFLPGALLARSLGRQDCLGATMALTRQTLDRIGGLHALVNHLADDAVLGRLVRAQGLRVELARTIPATTIPETMVPDLFAHELRWARTVKSVEPTGFVLSMVQYPLLWAALAVGVSGGAEWAWVLFGAAWAWRGAIAWAMNRLLGLSSGATVWCLPFRDLLSITVMIASYRTRRVAWRGQTLFASKPFASRPLASRAGLASGKG